jgi:hypothetical protein
MWYEISSGRFTFVHGKQSIIVKILRVIRQEENNIRWRSWWSHIVCTAQQALYHSAQQATSPCALALATAISTQRLPCRGHARTGGLPAWPRRSPHVRGRRRSGRICDQAKEPKLRSPDRIGPSEFGYWTGSSSIWRRGWIRMRLFSTVESACLCNARSVAMHEASHARSKPTSGDGVDCFLLQIFPCAWRGPFPPPDLLFFVRNGPTILHVRMQAWTWCVVSDLVN